ncbi:hypothetical protein LJC59_00135 [Desulfovibrio sp. OttesenSCG-928-A18]|nr:hypothetical protein [Desulfovibrio sp. OttesenSCG-928-A18]
MANMQPIREAFADTVDILGVKHFAHKWGHSRQYIERLWGDEDKNLPVHFIMDAMEDTGDFRILRAMALPLQRRISPISGKPDGEDMRHEIMQLVIACGEFVSAAESGACHTVLHDLLERMQKEAEDVFVRARERDEGGRS